MTNVYDERPWLNAYDPGIPAAIDIPEKTYTHALLEGLTSFPDRAAMHFMGATLSYRQLDKTSRRFAAFLTAAGVKPGDVVGLSLPNIPQFLIALCGPAARFPACRLCCGPRNCLIRSTIPDARCWLPWMRFLSA